MRADLTKAGGAAKSGPVSAQEKSHSRVTRRGSTSRDTFFTSSAAACSRFALARLSSDNLEVAAELQDASARNRKAAELHTSNATMASILDAKVQSYIALYSGIISTLSPILILLVLPPHLPNEARRSVSANTGNIQRRRGAPAR